MIVVKHLYPFAPLAALMGLSEHQAAMQLGLSGSTEQRYRREGMSERVADRLAVKAHLHPLEVWPEIIDEALVECARPGCSVRFVPSRANHRCCSKRCSKMIWARTDKGKAALAAAQERWRQSVPEYAARADREHGRRWRQANRDRKRAQDRAYYQRTAEQQKAAKRARYAAKKQEAA